MIFTTRKKTVIMNDIYSYIAEKKRQGLSEKQIAASFGMSVSELRARYFAAEEESKPVEPSIEPENDTPESPAAEPAEAVIEHEAEEINEAVDDPKVPEMPYKRPYRPKYGGYSS